MFAQRYDPEIENRKRRMSDSGSEGSDSEGSDSGSEESSDGSSEGSDSEESDESDDEMTSETTEMTSNKADNVNDPSGSEDSDSDSSNSDSDSSDSAPVPDDHFHNHDTPNDSVPDHVPVHDSSNTLSSSKHSSILSKFKSSMNNDPLPQSPSESVPVQDIAPLPQPELPRDKKIIPTANNNLNWLTTPIYSSPEITKPFDQFQLSSNLQQNLKSMGFDSAFSVQVSVLDMALNDIQQNKLKPDMNGDILVNASTGSGKTLAYSIPIIEKLSSRVVPRVRAIILVPTKPLINQVKQTINNLAKGTNLLITNLKPDLSIKEEGYKLLHNVPDVIISTPGRLVDHLNNNSISLSSLQYLVIDEADRLLNQSFQDWCSVLMTKIESSQTSNKTLANHWHLKVQKLIFSATLTTDAGKLSLLKFQNPRLIIINDKHQLVNEMFSVPNTLYEHVLKLGTSKNSLKPLILTKFLINQRILSHLLIFTKSNESCLRLTKLLILLSQKLGCEISIGYLNSTNNTNSIRNKLLKQFENNEINVLIVTDLIARGIDILSITHVINYELPNSSREYVHRVGRTARANQQGNAYNFCFGKGEYKWLSKLLKEISRNNEVDTRDLEVNDISDNDKEIYQECLEEMQKMV